jgi:AcrR family transcriptional regulator
MDAVLDKRERILAAAARLIVRNGLQCSMSAIAEEASVATGSLYNYFASKEALVRGVYGQVAEVMTAHMAAGDHQSSGPAARVAAYIARYIDFIWEDEQRSRLFDYLENSPLISLGDARAIFGPFVDSAIAMIEEAQAAGVVRAGPPTLIASFVRGAIRNFVKRRRLLPDPMTADERAMLTSMCWQAIALR